MQEMLTCASALTVFALIGSTTWAGDLDPPGAPASTPGPEARTPITALPISLEEPGSYFLVGNLTMTGEGHGITVASDDVTIDLNGFTLFGNTSAFTGSGIGVDFLLGQFDNVTVRNGIVRDWTEGGVALASAVNNARVENVQVFDCGGTGIHVNNTSIVTGCSAVECDGTGISVNFASIVENCVSNRNLADGIRTGHASVVRGCTARENVGQGFQMSGIVEGCTATENFEAGFSLGSGSEIFDCSAEYNDIGIRSLGGITVMDCRVDNSVSIGIAAGNRSMVRDCEVGSVENDFTVLGIEVEDDCDVRDCFVRGHELGAGIIVRGVNNRIEANYVLDNDVSIGVVTDNNVVIRNRVGRWRQNLIITGNPITNLIGPLVDDSDFSTTENPNVNFVFAEDN